MTGVLAHLTDGQLAALAALAAPPTALSPFSQLDGDAPEPLPAELLGADGSPTSPWRRVADVLATADRLGAVRFVGPEVMVQASTYGVAGSADTVMIRTGATGSEVCSPRLTGDLIVLLRELLGGGMTGPPAFGVELPIDHARVFVAVLDGVRRHTLRVLGGSSDRHEPVVRQSDILGGATTTPHLTSMVDDHLGATPLSRQQLDTGLVALAARGLVALIGDDVRLGDDTAALVTHLLVPSGHLRLRAAMTGPDGIDRVVDLLGLTGAGPGALVWQDAGDAVSLETMSGIVLLEAIRRFLTTPELIVAGALAQDGGVPDAPRSAPAGRDPVAPPPRGPDAAAVCTACGAGWRPGDKFCHACGAPAGEGRPSTCVDCGAELDAGVKFCRSCGAPTAPSARPTA